MTNGSTRRVFIQRSLATGAGLVGLAAAVRGGIAWSQPSGNAAADPTTREAFDQADLAINDGNGYKEETNDADSSGLSGKLAWNEAYVLQSYALMYKTHKDTHYLDKMIDHIDHVLANRDSERGVEDYQGKSQPSWRATHHYTIGSTQFSDAAGNPVLEVRSALAYGDEVVATVAAGSAAGTFKLDVRHDYYGRTTSYDNLSMDAQSADYAVTRVFEGFPDETPDRVEVTVKDLRQNDQGPVDLAPEDRALVSKPYIFEVHTGQIVLPLVQFARIVRDDPELRDNPTYNDKADEYLAAAEEAVAIHDPEWRETDAGEGYYITLPGAPVWHASIDNPFNHFLALGRAILQLAVVTGKQEYADKARKMGVALRNDMTDDGGANVWPYWWSKGAVYSGWDLDDPATEYRPWMNGRPVAEDVSHAQIDVNFALEMYQDAEHLGGDPVFSEADMQRFAATFTDNVAATVSGTATVYRFVDGSGETGLEAFERQAATWAGLTTWDVAVLDHLRAIFTSREFPPNGSLLYCLAWLNHVGQ